MEKSSQSQLKTGRFVGSEHNGDTASEMLIQRDHQVNSEGGLVDDEQVDFPTEDKGNAQAPE